MVHILQVFLLKIIFDHFLKLIHKHYKILDFYLKKDTKYPWYLP
ncbi:185L [Invertebrate iridescent virus 6]|uniref:185L n=1 Tax=Invertebrate iridescent virus 6 TaxID=176652 RepID=Q91FY1_IIV6|nr:185L [Invertebrate iridescent virus 6]AAK82051.1 185L [Invertebrate iridescent virus 6]QMS79561.1 hypothetical protein IIV6-T1_185 [Invertebrate iridescent virus 6]